ncbi:MAG: hypothetical protein L6Q47_04905 [Ignavibacteriaceae bacterium]|nr:hypothetical protein [Ignavibacteriaceae bacterium]
MMFFTITEDMIKEYILGKLPEEQARVVEQQLAKDSALKAQYDELKKKEDLLRYYDSMQLKEDRISVLKKRFDASRQNPVWGRGQVWKLHDFGWFLILAVNEQYQCRGIIMNHSTHFSGSRDILFHADTIASRRLCAFTDHICTVTPDNLTRYGGELNDQTVSIISAAVSGSTPKLPEGFSFGEDIHDEEAEVWHEYISDVCSRLTSEALEAYELANDLSKDILKLLPRKQYNKIDSVEESATIRFQIADTRPKKTFFSKFIKKKENGLPQKFAIFKNEIFSTELYFNKRMLGITFEFSFADNRTAISSLSLRHEGVSFFWVDSVPVTNKIAKFTFTQNEVIARIALLPVELLIELEDIEYKIFFDIRKI